jgi:hypothetical protein
MRHRNLLFTALAVPVLAWSAAALLQEEKKPAAQEPGEMGMPAPSPHNEALQDLEGTWDAELEMVTPGMPPNKSKSVETISTIGGFWIISDVRGSFMGMPFHGHGIYGYDSNKKKHVGVWADAFGDWMMTGEGTCEGACKKVTLTLKGIDMVTGKEATYREVTERKDADTRHWEMYGPGPDGSEILAMKGVFTRRK